MKSPCCIHEKKNARARWTPEKDNILLKYIDEHGEGCWPTVAMNSGLDRCCKSLRSRYKNHLRPDVRRGNFTQDEENLIIQLDHNGKGWSEIVQHPLLRGRTDNEIKNYWYTHLREKADLYKYMDENLEQIIDVDQRPPINNIPLINEEEAVIYPEASTSYN